MIAASGILANISHQMSGKKGNVCDIESFQSLMSFHRADKSLNPYVKVECVPGSNARRKA